MNDELVCFSIGGSSCLEAAHERPMTELRLSICAEYFSRPREGQSLRLLLFHAVVFDGRFEEDTFVTEGTI